MKPLSQQNLYEVLDVPFDATPAVIAEAVERAMALYAPGSLATYTLVDPEEERLLARLLEEARSTLLDPSARARYDELITGPDQEPATAPSPTLSPQAMDPMIRAAWPELPPDVPAARARAGEDWEEELDEEEADELVEAEEVAEEPPAAEAAAPPPLAQPPPAKDRKAQAAVPPALPAAAARPAPILLQRVVEAAPAAPSAAAPAPAPAQPAPEPASAPPAEVDLVPVDAIWSGAVLRRIREARGISVQQVSERTRVTRHHVENVEGDRFDQLPATVYLRGILLALSRELRLDGQKVARSYLERVAAARGAGAGQRPR